MAKRSVRLHQEWCGSSIRGRSYPSVVRCCARSVHTHTGGTNPTRETSPRSFRQQGSSYWYPPTRAGSYKIIQILQIICPERARSPSRESMMGPTCLLDPPLIFASSSQARLHISANPCTSPCLFRYIEVTIFHLQGICPPPDDAEPSIRQPKASLITPELCPQLHVLFISTSTHVPTSVISRSLVLHACPQDPSGCISQPCLFPGLSSGGRIHQARHTTPYPKQHLHNVHCLHRL